MFLGLKYVSNHNDEKLLPCFSLCPLPAYKSPDWSSSFTKKGYKENTFKLQDIFSNKTIDMLQNKTEFSVTETESILLGVCQTVCKLKKVKAFYYNFVLDLKRNWNINIYFHPKGSEFLFFYSAVGLSSQMLTLNTKNNSDDIIAVDLSINEIQTYVTSKKDLDCKPYKIDTENFNYNKEYMACLKRESWLKLRSSISCTIGGMATLFEKDLEIAEMEECKDYETAVKTRTKIGDIISALLANSSSYNCPPPCQIVSYSMSPINYHNNSLLKEYYNLVDGEHFLLSLYYNTLVIEKRTETLLYDVAGMLASAGGNLGLMLGFSCLSLLFLGVDCIKSFCLKIGLANKICVPQNPEKH